MLGGVFAEGLTETTSRSSACSIADGHVILFNDACERTTGFSRDEALGSPPFESVIPREEAEAFARRSPSSGRMGYASHRSGMGDEGRRRRLIAWSNKPVEGDDGLTADLVTSGIDLTVRAVSAETASRRWKGPVGEGRRGRTAR